MIKKEHPKLIQYFARHIEKIIKLEELKNKESNAQ